jgi:predicted phosphodiesterase
MRKILISSDPHGHFDLLLPKVSELNAKNKFDFMIITGSVCPSNSSPIFKDILDSKLTVPLPTYFIDNSDMSYVLSVVHPDGF